MKKILTLALCLQSVLFSCLYGQDLAISFDVPSPASVCGPAVTATITVSNNGAEVATNVAGALTFPPEVFILDIQAPAAGSPGNLTLGDIPAGGSVDFDLVFQLGCGARMINPASFGFQLDLSSDEGTTASEVSGAVDIIFADLSMPPPITPNRLNAYLGFEETITTRVANGGFGSVAEFSYCVSNNLTHLQLNGILVGGNDITGGGIAFSSGNFNCYTVTSADLMAAGLGGTLDPLERVPVAELWEVVGCVNSSPDIRRRVQYGCQGDLDCQEKPNGDFASTPVSYATRFPNFNIANVSSTRPACYMDEPTMATVRITNDGNAPGKNLGFRITTAGSNGMIIDPASVVITNDQTGMVIPPTAYTVSNLQTGASCQGNGLIRSDYRLNELVFDIGESVTVSYNVLGTCACNNCDIRNKYFSNVQLRDYDDLCNNRQTDRGSVNPNGRYNAFMQGLAEGTASLTDGETGRVSYFITEMELDWLVPEFPEAYLEAIITLPCGLDYVDNSFSWVDRDNDPYPIANVSYTDANTIGAQDELRIRFNAAAKPGNFLYAGGANFDFMVIADCTEKDISVCGEQVFDEQIPARFELTTDPTCSTDCTPQKIFRPDTLDVRLTCIDNDQCAGECDGIQFAEFSVSRTNLGLADTDNNQVPDGTNRANPATAQTDRYWQGDTLRASFQGTVRDDDNSRNFAFGFIEFPFEHGDFTPLGATLTVTDATNGTNYVCNAVPLVADGPNQQIIVNFSVAALQSFGCGLPVGFSYEDGDVIDVVLEFTEKNELLGEPFKIRDFEPRFYVSETGRETGGQCNALRARMTQVGFFTGFGNNGGDFGACDLPGWSLTYSRYAGGVTLDEFANEIRPIALSDRLVFTKPAEFAFRLDQWRVTLEQQIEPNNNIVNNSTIPANFFVLNGDEVTLLLGDYFKSLGNSEVPPDEGFRLVVSPRIQGNCESVPAEYNYSYQLFEEVDANIFCTPEIARPPFAGTFEYTGAAQLVVEAVENNIRLCSNNERTQVRVRNVSTPNATNAFFYPQPTGQVLINRVEDANGNEILPNAFGIYPLGTINGQTTRDLFVFFSKNTCEDTFIDFIAGWDCEGTPTTIADAICADPSRVSLTSANSNVDMLITEPVGSSNSVIDLCETVVFSADIISTDLGYLRDIVLTFGLPPSLTYEPGSFEIAVPTTSLGGSYMMTVDPVAIGGNQHRIDLSALDPILDTEGLVGSKDLDNSIISIRFTAKTGCGFLSGSRAVFTVRSNNSCGDPLPPVARRSGRIRTSERPQDISIAVTPLDLTLNACNEQTETIRVTASIGGSDLSDVDSIRVLLPPGIEYIPNSYVPGQNANPTIAPENLRSFNGQMSILFPLTRPENGETTISFALDIRAADIGQLCQIYPLMVDAFASIEDECEGVVCRTNEIRGEATAILETQKPDLDFTAIDGDVTLNPADGTALADFTVTIINNGFALAAGNDVTLAIYEDVNDNGTFEEGTDRFLFEISEALNIDLLPGQRITLSGAGSFPAADICTVIAVLDPNRTCTCSTQPSATFRPEVIYEFERDYAVCAGETVAIGPEPVAGYTYEWISVAGSNLANLTPRNLAMTTFTAPANNTGAPIIVQYALRVVNAPCFSDQLVSITIAPSLNEVTNVQACIGSSFNLPTTTQAEATNFSWSPTTGLTLSADGKTASVDNVQAGPTTYVLTYEIGDGCPAVLTVNLTGQDCGPAEAAVGDFVWFDFNGDGIQDPEEPPVSGVTVYLINGNNGAIISTETTDANGNYLFDGLVAGNYAVRFIAPAGFAFTGNNAGTDDTIDSDADPNTGQTPALFVPLDSTDLNFDGGLIPDCSLELELTVGNCAPSGDTLARRLLLTATWTGNPYTYDQFNDGNDTLDVMIGGATYTIVIGELDGTVTVFDSLVAPANSTAYSVTAAFRESTACIATISAPAFAPCKYDLALTKTASTRRPTPGPYAYGDLVCMDITVFNQGEQPVSRVQVFDTLPAGMVFNRLTSDLGWNSISPLQIFTFPGQLAPNAQVTTTICVNLRPTGGGAGNYTNIAEINSFADAMGNDFSDYDEDSTPDHDFSNDAGGEPEGPTDNITNGNPNDPNLPNDEDDSDPFLIHVYDLALIKLLETAGPYALGDTLTYTIQVINQGNDTAKNVTVIDYLPAGLLLLDDNSPVWSGAAAGAMGGTETQATLTAPLNPGDTVFLPLRVRFTGVAGVLDYVNRAEILSDDGNDYDSETNYGPGNDPGGSPGSPADNATGGDGSGTPGDSDPATDADSADPALFSVQFVSIGSTVFLDTDNNGRQDPGEIGIPGVRVELYQDTDANGTLEGAELTALATITTGPNGLYFFGELLPGNYQVQIPASQFGVGEVLEFTPRSSTDITTTPFDNQIDEDDNGLQADSAAVTASPFVNLQAGEEPLNAREPGSGGLQDGTTDANGDMTVDFGFVCNLNINVTTPYITICSARLLDLRPLATITPPSVNGTWTSSGDGVFLDINKQELSAPVRYDEAVFYRAGKQDALSGSTVLTLTTDAAGLCPPVVGQIEVVVLNVDCGSFFWDGN